MRVSLYAIAAFAVGLMMVTATQGEPAAPAPAATADIDPCAGISPGAIIAAFNRHGIRLGGPSGVPLTAVAFSQLSEHIVGCGQRCGPCTGLLTIADPQGRTMTVQENVVPRRGALGDFEFVTVQDLR
jgi:hypothetical protein